MKRIMPIFLAFVLVLSLFSFSTQSAFAEEGSQKDAGVVEPAADLHSVSEELTEPEEILEEPELVPQEEDEPLTGEQGSLTPDEDGIYHITCFEDLEELCANPPAEANTFCFVDYVGTDNFVIERDITIPENLGCNFNLIIDDYTSLAVVIPEGVTLTNNGSTSCIDAVINGTLINNSDFYVSSNITITGSVINYSRIQISGNSAEGTIDRITECDGSSLTLEFSVIDEENLQVVLQQSACDDAQSHFYNIALEDYIEGKEIQISSDLTINKNCLLWLFSPCSVLSEAVLTNNGEIALCETMCVEGTLVNNYAIDCCLSFEGSLLGSLSLSENGSYRGLGSISTSINAADSEEELFETLLPGFDRSLFDVTVSGYACTIKLKAAVALAEIAQTAPNSTPDKIRAQVQALGVSYNWLASALRDDMGTDEAAGAMQELETYTGGALIEVTADMTGTINAGQVSIIGASLNNPTDSAKPVKLVISGAEEDDPIPEGYSRASAIRFSMELENVVSDPLAVPVKITLPVPSGIAPDALVILHYHVPGEDPEEIQPYIFQQDGQYYASFVLTRFCDFIMTVPASERTPGDCNGDGSVDIFDLLALKKQLAGMSVEIEQENADVNGDGSVDIFDLLLLKKYLAGMDVELK